MRAAICAANQMVVHMTKEISDEEFKALCEALMDYLKTAESFEDADDLAALKRMKGD